MKDKQHKSHKSTDGAVADNESDGDCGNEEGVEELFADEEDSNPDQNPDIDLDR